MSFDFKKDSGAAMKEVRLSLPEELVKWAENMAEINGGKYQDVLRQAIEYSRNKFKPKSPADFAEGAAKIIVKDLEGSGVKVKAVAESLKAGKGLLEILEENSLDPSVYGVDSKAVASYVSTAIINGEF